MAYEKTEVSVSRSQEQIRDVLIRHRAARVNFGEEFLADGSMRVGVEFVFQNTLVRMLANVKAAEHSAVFDKHSRSRSGKSMDDVRHEMGQQEARRIWRVLHWAIKVRMEAIEEGLELFEQAFLAHIVDPSTGTTLWDNFEPAIAAGGLRLGGLGLRALNPAPPHPDFERR